MQSISKVRRAFRSVVTTGPFRAISTHGPHDNRLRGGTVFSVAAKAGAAGSLASPSGGGFGQTRHQTAPAAGRRGGGGRGCEYPARPARQALDGICAFLTTMLVMGWPVLVIGLAIANPPPAGVFAYLTNPKEMTNIAQKSFRHPLDKEQSDDTSISGD